MRLKNKIAIITGSASGFGKGIAKKFSQEGAKLIMVDINSKLLKKNTRSISRTLKREKVKFKAKDVVDIMATSVFFYIEEAFIKK